MNYNDDEFTGRINASSFIKNKKEKTPYYDYKEKSKPKDRQKDYSKARDKKRGYE
jgi:hypothetical protein